MFPRFPIPQRHTVTSRLHRRGFTLPEILIVIVMISLLAIIAVPRFANANNRRHMESARMRVAAALATARQAAIQKGHTVQFKIAAHRVTVRLGDTLNLVSPIPLDTLYKVEADQNYTIDFSARGFANLNDKKIIRLTRSGVPNDSVLISKTGMVQR